MGKRKKRGAKGGASKKPPQLDLDYNPFAGLKGQRDQLRAETTAQKAAEEKARADRARIARQAQMRSEPMVASKQWVETGAVQMTDEQLFEAALSGIDVAQIHAGKYGGAGPSVSHVLPPAPPKPDLGDDPYAGADDLFSREFGGDVRLVDDKYHVVEAAARLDVDALYKFRQRKEGTGATREDLLEELLCVGGPTLSREQIRLIEDARRWEKKHRALHELNLRGMSETVALHAVEVGLRGRTYVRVITGKGLQSAGEPVLKRALVVWCLSHQVAWAPELFSDGSFGSFVIRQSKKK
jgi:hypothetical protein